MKFSLGISMFGLLSHVEGIIVSRKVCFDAASCLGEDAENSLVLIGDEEAPLFAFDDEVDSTICLSGDDTKCLFLPEVEGSTLILSEEESSLFNFLLTGVEFDRQLFQIQIGESNDDNCITKSLAADECLVFLNRVFEEIDELEAEQLVLLLEEGEEITDDESDNNSGREAFDYPIGILIFQLMLLIGFVAVVVALVYRYDLVPPRIKLMYQAMFRKKGIKKNELAEISAAAIEVQESRRGDEKEQD